MNRLMNVIALTTLFALCGLTGYQIEQYRNGEFMDSIQATAKMQSQIRQAQQYSGPLVSAVRDLTTENAQLVERDRRAAQVVAGLQEEGVRLKASLKEAVENLQTLSDTNNTLQSDIDKLEYKVRTLEEALKAIQAVKDNIEPPCVLPVVTPDPPKNEIPKK